MSRQGRLQGIELRIHLQGRGIQLRLEGSLPWSQLQGQAGG